MGSDTGAAASGSAGNAASMDPGVVAASPGGTATTAGAGWPVSISRLISLSAKCSDLAGTRLGEELAVIGAQLGGLSVHIRAGQGKAIVFVDEAGPHIHVGSAVSPHAFLVDLVHREIVFRRLGVAGRRQADPDHRKMPVVEGFHDGIDPSAIRVAPRIR